MLELLESLLCNLVRHFFFLPSSLCFPDVIKAYYSNLRVSSLTESDLCKVASVFHTLSNFQLLSLHYAARLHLVTNWFCHGLTEMTSIHRQEGAAGAELHRLLTSRRFGTGSVKSANPLEQNARLLLLRLEWSVRRLLRRSGA